MNDLSTTAKLHFLPLNFKGPDAHKALVVIGNNYAGIAWFADDHTQEVQHYHAQIVLDRDTSPDERQTLGDRIQEVVERELDADIVFDSAAYGADYAQPEPGNDLDYLNGRVIDVDRVLLDDPEQPVDDELDQILADAPKVMKAYMKWQKTNAFRVHPTFALFSVLLFIQAFVGRNVRLPRDLRINLWMLLFAPSESGKGAALKLAADALKELSDKKIFPAVLHFGNRYGSPESMLWKFVKTPQVVWANDELVKILIGLMSAPIGSSQYNMLTVLKELHDAATVPYIAPIDYSGHDKRTKDMPPLEYPFLTVAGLGVPRNIGHLNAAAAEDGTLNRFLAFVVEGLPPIGSGLPVTPLPTEVVNWAAAIQAEKFVEFFDPNTPPSKFEPHVLEVYPAFYRDWERESEYGARLAQDLPGIWGRYAEKVLQVAMLYALTDTMKVTPEGFAWAVRLVRWAVVKFAQRFVSEGGGAVDSVGKLRNALVAFLKKESVIHIHDKVGHISYSYLTQYCRAWRENLKDQAAVIKALEDVGLIVSRRLKRGGQGLTLLKWAADAPPDEPI